MPKTDLKALRELAWIGDSVLELYARLKVLKEHGGIRRRNPEFGRQACGHGKEFQAAVPGGRWLLDTFFRHPMKKRLRGGALRAEVDQPRQQHAGI